MHNSHVLSFTLSLLRSFAWDALCWWRHGFPQNTMCPLLTIHIRYPKEWEQIVSSKPYLCWPLIGLFSPLLRRVFSPARAAQLPSATIRCFCLCPSRRRWCIKIKKLFCALFATRLTLPFPHFHQLFTAKPSFHLLPRFPLPPKTPLPKSLPTEKPVPLAFSRYEYIFYSLAIVIPSSYTHNAPL